MQTVKLLLACLVLASCGESLLHEDYVIHEVPDTVTGAQPRYAEGRLPSPTWGTVPDTLRPARWGVGQYLVHVVPYEGVALWRVDGRDTIADRFLRVPGLLDFLRERDVLYLGRDPDRFTLDLSRAPATLNDGARNWRHFDRYRFLSGTLQHSGYARPYTHLECPDTTRVLRAFYLTELTAPGCFYD